MAFVPAPWSLLCPSWPRLPGGYKHDKCAEVRGVRACREDPGQAPEEARVAQLQESVLEDVKEQRTSCGFALAGWSSSRSRTSSNTSGWLDMGMVQWINMKERAKIQICAAGSSRSTSGPSSNTSGWRDMEKYEEGET